MFYRYDAEQALRRIEAERDEERREKERYEREAADLRYEMEREREDRRREQAREREQYREEMRERFEIERTTADSWPEAFQKQLANIAREKQATMFGQPLYSDPDSEEDRWVYDWEKGVEKAQEIWREEARTLAPLLDWLDQARELFEAALRERVAARLEAELSASEQAGVVEAIRDNDPEHWLSW